VIEGRRYLTSEIQQLTEDELCGSLRAMRAACRRFLEAVDDRDESWSASAAIRGAGRAGDSAGALGQLRGVFGVHIARIAAPNRLDI
jgi:hypothetical protein